MVFVLLLLMSLPYLYYIIIVTIQSQLENLTDFLAVASRQMNLQKS